MDKVWNNQPDCVAASGCETARQQIGPVIQFFYALENALARLLAHVWFVPQHL